MIYLEISFFHLLDDENEMKYFRLRPEIPAYIGEKTVYDKSCTPWYIDKLHLRFEGWFGDDLMKTSPVFYVTGKLKEGLENSELSGVSSFEDIEVTKSENFEELYPNKELPEFYFFRINGVARQDDFGIEVGKLIVSEKALEFLKGFNLSETKIEELENA